MNKAAIKAELRRSACEDKSPFFDCHSDAFYEALEWRLEHDELLPLSGDVLRTIFLFAAEAL